MIKLYADVAHLVERHLAKVEVAGPSPVIRSILVPDRVAAGGFSVYTAKSFLQGRIRRLHTMVRHLG